MERGIAALVCCVVSGASGGLWQHSVSFGFMVGAGLLVLLYANNIKQV